MQDINLYMKNIVNACKNSMRKKSYNFGHRANYWWNDNIKDLRSKTNRSRRIMQRKLKKGLDATSEIIN